MKSQHQNFQDHRSRNYNTQEATVNIKSVMTVTEETLNQDNRICYKKRREELNRRVKRVLEQKKQIASTRNFKTKK